jgi:hypothetical protein
MTSQERIKKVFLDTNFYYNVEKQQIDLFIEAVDKIKTKKPVMIELGVGHLPTYSQAFNAYFNGNCLNVCTDILDRQIKACKDVFPNAVYYHGYSGTPIHSGENKPDASEKLTPLNLKDIIIENNIEYVDILHFDVQGSEIYVLKEIYENNLHSMIGNMFISVHGTFNECIKLIDKCSNYRYKFKDPYSGGYGDGLIVIEKV